MKNDIGLIHFQIDDSSQFNLELIDGVDLIRINSKIPKTDIQQFITQVKNSIIIVIIDDIKLSKAVNADGVFVSNPENFEEYKGLKNDVLIGGMAHNLADCKNWEMIGADFIDFNPPKSKKSSTPIGSEGFQDLPSKNEVYGWMLFSINVPVFIHHPRSIANIQEIKKTADVHGVSLSNNFEQDLFSLVILSEIRETLK